ncbi:hypothetical protein SAMN05216257_102355 [Meinhardsimonia xiamenensis]|jgi:hypothetical protein|uniref:Transmembrane protein n=1 Tax=Meinhardsimonia xiamenensis TaxID=990712 RepID=A0A1G9B2U5_9RHOB|nr:DUF6524 family protein [Meinhardsimonia xiamenensis]PRX35169.1 hypothetical protein LV81_01764 [Meinhardsimonia xiamenensis]SDK33145.1 hypothetical protein SAMN05216257_102355 [Meinhardsimonia xiamenensis]
MGFFFRWLFAFVLLAATFNPTDWNYVSWARTNWESDPPLTIFTGLLLVVGYIIYLRATLRSIGFVGMMLVLAIVGSALWLAYDRGWLDPTDTTANVWIGIFALSIVLGTGLSWSLIRRRLSGQFDVDDVEE